MRSAEVTHSQTSTIDTLNQQGIAFGAHGNFAEALDCFAKALAIAPDEPEILNNIGLTLYKSGDHRTAIAYYRRALAIRPGNLDALNNLGLCLYSSKQYAGAILQWVRSLIIDPNRPDIVFDCGVANLMLGNLITAALLFSRVVELDRTKHDDPNVLNYAAYTFAVLNKKQSDLAHVDRSLADATADIHLYLRARVKLARGQTQAALRLLAEAIAKDSALADVAKQDIQLQELLNLDSRFRNLVGLTFSQNELRASERQSSKAATLYERKQYQTAIPLLTQALAARRKLFGENSRLAILLRQLAIAQLEVGHYSEGAGLLQDLIVLMMTTRGVNSSEYLDTLATAADLYHRFGADKTAAVLYQRAITITRRALGSSPDFGALLTNAAIFHLDLDNHQESETLYKEALQLAREGPQGSVNNLVISFDNLARHYLRTGNYKEGGSLCRETVDIARKKLGPKNVHLARSLVTLALFYLTLGNDRKASALLKQNLVIVQHATGRGSPDTAQACNDLAHALTWLGEHTEAEILFKRALKIYESTDRDESLAYAGSMSNLAWLYQRVKKYGKAECLYKRAIAIMRRRGHEFYSSLVGSNLATLYQDTGAPAKALPLYLRILQSYTNKFGANHPDLMGFKTQLAGVHEDLGHHTEALRILKDALESFDEIIRLLLSIRSDDQRRAYLSRIRTAFELYISLVLRRFPRSQPLKCEALDLVLRRKGIGLEASYTQRDVLMRKYDHVAPQLKKLRSLQAEIAKKSILGPQGMELRVHNKLLAKLTSEEDLLEQELARQIPEADLDAKLRAIDRRQIARALPPDSVLLEFIAIYMEVPSGRSKSGHLRLVVFVLHSGDPDHVELIDLGSVAVIDDLVKAFRKSLMSFETPADISRERVAGVRVRQAVFDPLVDTLGGKTEILVAVDGNLVLLPFEILPNDDGGRLVDKYRISYLSTARDVLRFKRFSETAATKPVVIADPDFDLKDAPPPPAQSRSVFFRSRNFDPNQVTKFERLEGTRNEGKHVADLLGVVPWFAGDALEGKLKSILSPRVLHIASHAFFLPDQERNGTRDDSNISTTAVEQGFTRLKNLENPLLRSGIALAGANVTLQGGIPANRDAQDGILTAQDVVADLDLSATDLVVLSACETGLGDVETGEGVFGLRRSFGLAGAQTLVMSLWQVDDTITQEMMHLFYGVLLQGKSCVEALNQAQLEIRKQWPQPYFWGAFICQGNPQAIYV
jgi:CHAT domain-containing protein/tetratricopeptide (TPR) repeat protein